MNMSRDSTSLKKSSGECLKLAKQRYSILSEMMLFLNYSIFSGSAEALVRCGGKLQQLLIAHFLSDMCAKHYDNPTMLSKVTAKNVGVFFETHCRNIALLYGVNIILISSTIQARITCLTNTQTEWPLAIACYNILKRVLKKQAGLTNMLAIGKKNIGTGLNILSLQRNAFEIKSSNNELYITVCTVVQNCCKGHSKKYRKWHSWGCCHRETP